MRRPDFISILATTAILVAGCARRQSPRLSAAPSIGPTTVEQIAVEYKNYRQVTARPVEVNLELSLLCRGANQHDVELARVKHGPHAHAAIRVFMDDAAAVALVAGNHRYPVGSVIVKEKEPRPHLDPNAPAKIQWRTPACGVGGMVKRPPGYDPAHGDWEFFFFEDPSRIESGRLPNCIQCHDAAVGGDHVFATWREHRE